MSIFPTDSIKTIAETMGISDLRDDVATLFACDVEYRLREIAQEAIKFMRHAHRPHLTSDDVNDALRVRNIEPLYGFSSNDPIKYRKITESNHEHFFIVEDEELSLEDVIHAELPKVPLDVSLTAHWLAIEGVQPAIPQNPPPKELRMAAVEEEKQKTQKDSELGVLSLGEGEFEVKPLVKHLLSKELQIYYETLTKAVVDREAPARSRAFESLSQDPGLHPLIPYFVRFITEKVTRNLKNLFILRSMMWMAKCILGNPNFFIEPYLHQLMPSIMTCMLGKRLCEDPSNEDHWSLREFSALLTAEICRKYGDAYHTLQPRIAKTLLHAFLDSTKPFTTHYGAITGLSMLNKEVIRVLLLPNVKAYGKLIEADLKEKDSSTEATRSMEARKCVDAISETVARYLREELEAEYRLHHPGATTVELNLRNKLRDYREHYGMFADSLIPLIQANHFVERSLETYRSKIADI